MTSQAATPFGITTGTNRVIPQYDSTRQSNTASRGSHRSSSSSVMGAITIHISFISLFFHFHIHIRPKMFRNETILSIF